MIVVMIVIAVMLAFLAEFFQLMSLLLRLAAILTMPADCLVKLLLGFVHALLALLIVAIKSLSRYSASQEYSHYKGRNHPSNSCHHVPLLLGVTAP
jgi:hypothetical protein